MVMLQPSPRRVSLASLLLLTSFDEFIAFAAFEVSSLKVIPICDISEHPSLHHYKVEAVDTDSQTWCIIHYL